jgi:molybdenum-dependent DNA-binding transcriptional regulator ModE
MNFKLNIQRQSSMFLALFLLVVAVLACGGTTNETPQANKLVDEGNAAVQEAKKFVTDAEAKKDQMLHTKISQLAEARTLAKEAVAAYDKAEEKCKEAAKKYDEASKLKINDKFKEYLALKVKEYNKRAELVETARATPQALIDSESKTSFVTRVKAANEKIDALGKEANGLAAQAEKLEKDNPDIFKS